MVRWPSLRRVLIVWGTVSAVACFTYVSYLRSLPPDDLVMASDLSFQAMIGVIVIGVPSLVFLFLFLLIGAIAKHWLLEPRVSNAEPGPMGLLVRKFTRTFLWCWLPCFGGVLCIFFALGTRGEPLALGSLSTWVFLSHTVLLAALASALPAFFLGILVSATVFVHRSGECGLTPRSSGPPSASAELER
jgi:hypothetical protein